MKPLKVSPLLANMEGPLLFAISVLQLGGGFSLALVISQSIFHKDQVFEDDSFCWKAACHPL